MKAPLAVMLAVAALAVAPVLAPVPAQQNTASIPSDDRISPSLPQEHVPHEGRMEISSIPRSEPPALHYWQIQPTPHPGTAIGPGRSQSS